MVLKGQNFRVFFNGSVTPIAEATNCTINLTTNTSDISTKDTAGMGTHVGVESQAWQVTVDTMDVSNLNALLTAIKNGTKVSVSWDQTDTSNNKTPTSADFACGGDAYITDMTVNFNDREWSTSNIQFTGTDVLATTFN